MSLNQKIANQQSLIDSKSSQLDSLKQLLHDIEESKGKSENEIKTSSDTNLKLNQEIVTLRSRINFYEESSTRLSQMNKDLLDDKRTYLSALLNRQKEITVQERKYQDEINKLTIELKTKTSEINDIKQEANYTLQKYQDQLTIC